MSSSAAAAEQHRHHAVGGRELVPLAALIKEESRTERHAVTRSRICAREDGVGGEVGEAETRRPLLRYGCAAQSKKGEDFFLLRTDCARPSTSSSSSTTSHPPTFAVFAVLDGHNGDAAAIYTRDNLLNHVLSAMPQGLSREEWLHSLPRALVAGFVKTDKEFQTKGQTSGTTATFAIIDGWTITVASVGDSRCILDAQGGAVSLLTVDHRLEENVEERERVTASGGEVGRLSVVGGAEIGPLRCWPGGLCLSRSIGDIDVGEFIVPVPYVKQVKLSNTGGRLIIASDGIWDALSSDAAAKCCRGLPAELAAKQIVKEALKTRGLKDDTTCVVVDIIPPDQTIRPLSPPKKMNKLKSLIFRKKAKDQPNKLTKQLSSVGMVEEIFEEGSAILSERLGNDSGSRRTSSSLFTCAICQADLEPSEGTSVHVGSVFSSSSKPWEGPFLCSDCRDKKDAMEGKRPSGVKVL
ncbi:probable protein phosphatase 2C 3 isoform X1 [Triticum urartu]|uniref:protein-serine/threonine phosphatase n=2 Tax=Triticum urartu TaxID=4572 RepID=A0A8R7TUC1_TRIUA|nr:probable protein phosphatase 2C 3 isoform X1 [Triticum urartu]